MAAHVLEVAEWPSARDVSRQLNVSAVQVNRLIHAGRLQAVRTRLGWLLDPESVREYAKRRPVRRKGETISC